MSNPLATVGPRLELLGHQLRFYGQSVRWSPRALVRYRKEVFAVLADATFGSGGLAIVGGTVGVIVALSFFAGTEVGIQSHASLDQIGAANFSAFISAYFNTREVGAAGRRRSRWPPRSAAATPRSWARCGSARRSTPSR